MVTLSQRILILMFVQHYRGDYLEEKVGHMFLSLCHGLYK